MNLRELTSIALFAVAANPTQAQETIPVARIDSVFAEHNRSDRPGCTLAVFKNGEIAYANGYGMANLEYGIALRPTSVFHNSVDLQTVHRLRCGAPGLRREGLLGRSDPGLRL
ncbi:MAG: hypothetical protein ACE1ZX_03965 [Acidimicrobiia bacterium]